MEDQKRTIRALGFTKLNQSKEVEGTPQIMGMINKVAHLLKVEKI
jgi:large subunit ribosomal protein L30